MSARDKKNPILRLALGAYDLYNITGWVSDVLSYSRLLALGLATGVIASVINQMGSMVGNNVFGVIVFILVFCSARMCIPAVCSTSSFSENSMRVAERPSVRLSR